MGDAGAGIRPTSGIGIVEKLAEAATFELGG